MDQSRKSPSLVRSLALLLGGVALGALWKGRPAQPEVVRTVAPPAPRPALPPAAQRRPLGRRVGVAATFVALFALGGALTAWGGDRAAQLVDDPALSAPAEPVATADTVAVETLAATTTEAASAQGPVVEVADATAQGPTPEPGPQPAEDSAPAKAADVAAPEPPAPPASTRLVVEPELHVAPVAVRRHAVRAPRAVEPDPEATAAGVASVVWLRRTLPDPTPPSRRLARPFVHALYRAAGTSWPLELGLLEAGGSVERELVGPLAGRIATLQAKGADDRTQARALTPDAAAADRAVALEHYYRALGTETLVVGLEGSKPRLERRLLADPRVTIYPAGRLDVEAGRVDVRVLATIAYLADTFGGVEVSSLVTGHRLYASPRVVSAHVFGDAVDVAALGGRTIAGNQEPGGLTEQAVRALLLLPAEASPRQVISLLGLGGPSFALADHADHIHVGF